MTDSLLTVEVTYLLPVSYFHHGAIFLPHLPFPHHETSLYLFSHIQWAGTWPETSLQTEALFFVEPWRKINATWTDVERVMPQVTEESGVWDERRPTGTPDVHLGSLPNAGDSHTCGFTIWKGKSLLLPPQLKLESKKSFSQQGGDSTNCKIMEKQFNL